MAASWDPERKITYAFMQLCANPDREYIPRIRSYLISNPRLAKHPMVLPTLTMDLETTATLADDQGWTQVVQEVEHETGQRPGDFRVVDPLEINLPSIVQRLNGCSCFLSLIERESEAVLLHLTQTRQAILDLQDNGQHFGGVTSTLVRHVDFLTESRKNLFMRLQNLQRRSQMQLRFVRPCLSI